MYFKLTMIRQHLFNYLLYNYWRFSEKWLQNLYWEWNSLYTYWFIYWEPPLKINMIMQAFHKSSLLVGSMKISYLFISHLLLVNLHFYFRSFHLFFISSNCFLLFFMFCRYSSSNNYLFYSKYPIYFLKINLKNHFIFIIYLLS